MKKNNVFLSILIIINIVVIIAACFIMVKVTSNNAMSNKKVVENKSIESTKTIDYKSFIGTWEDPKTANDFTIYDVTDNTLTFTWYIVRLAGVDDKQTIPFNDGEAVFYFEGYADKNFDGKDTEDEKYMRKATINLEDSGVNVTIEDVNNLDGIQNVFENDRFPGSMYITSGYYPHANKIK